MASHQCRWMHGHRSYRAGLRPLPRRRHRRPLGCVPRPTASVRRRVGRLGSGLGVTWLGFRSDRWRQRQPAVPPGCDRRGWPCCVHTQIQRLGAPAVGNHSRRSVHRYRRCRPFSPRGWNSERSAQQHVQLSRPTRAFVQCRRLGAGLHVRRQLFADAGGVGRGCPAWCSGNLPRVRMGPPQPRPQHQREPGLTNAERRLWRLVQSSRLG